MAESLFYHATINNLDGQHFFARGQIPTVHQNLTYAAWYGYWLARMAGNSSRFAIYSLRGAVRYLSPVRDGMYCVKPIGSFEGDDREIRVLEQAPELFRRRWKWAGKLTYIPVRCLERITPGAIITGIDPEEWSRLSREVSQNLVPDRFKTGWSGRRMVPPATVPDNLPLG